LPQYVNFFLQSNLEKYKFLKVHKFCYILCFILKICHNFKSYQNMLTLSSLIFNIISYKFFFNNIYIASHLHVEKDSRTFLKPYFLINIKLKRKKIWMCLIVSYYYKKVKDEINCIMKIKGPFMKVVSLKLLNIFYSNQTLIFKFCLIHFRFFNIHIIQ
jgi:hypothetical protein